MLQNSVARSVLFDESRRVVVYLSSFLVIVPL